MYKNAYEIKFTIPIVGIAYAGVVNFILTLLKTRRSVEHWTRMLTALGKVN